MSRFSASLLFAGVTLLASFIPSVSLAQQAVVHYVSVLPATKDVEIEIQATQRITPQTLEISGPNRLVLDFEGAIPGDQLRSLVINRGGVKSVRAGLFRSKPPVTRIVLDLEKPVPYKIFPSGSSVIVKLGAEAPAVADASSATAQPPAEPQSFVKVRFQNGLMSLMAERSNLAAVLAEIRNQTGADMAIPAGAEQDQVTTTLGPAPAQDVLASLLNGSSYNFVVVGSNIQTKLQSVILTPKNGEGVTVPAAAPATYNYTPPPVTPPTQVENPEPEPMPDVPPPDQQVPEVSGDQANDVPQPEQPPQDGAQPNAGTPPQ